MLGTGGTPLTLSRQEHLMLKAALETLYGSTAKQASEWIFLVQVPFSIIPTVRIRSHSGFGSSIQLRARSSSPSWGKKRADWRSVDLLKGITSLCATQIKESSFSDLFLY